MARLTLRLPETLHQALVDRAAQEGVSMNQYLVYLLARSTAVESAANQKAEFEKLRGRFTDDQAEQALSALLEARA